MAARANLATISQQFKRGALRPIDLVDRCLERIKQHESTIHAWVKVDERGARQAAQVLGDELERGQSRGPLHGIPVGIKDIFDVSGWSTKAGSSLRAQHVAQEDATVVSRLRAGGAILLGKTVTTEYACFDPSVTHNPWNPAHTPGGSSAGSAAAVALGMCLAAVGSQTGGSITRPASYCGVAGIKPTFGLLDLGGAVPVSFHLDHAGAMARSVSDLAAMLLVMSTPTAEEGTPQDAPHVNYLAAGESARLPRLGVIEPFFLERCDDAVKTGFRQAIDNLRQGGAQIINVTPPTSFADLLPLHRKIMAVEAAAYHRAAFEANRAAYGKQIGGLIDEGLRMPAYEYAMAIRHLEWYREHAWDDLPEIDALVTPATTTPAPARLDTTGDPQFNSPWSYAGLPTVSIPCSLSREGLPIAMQLIGPKLSELTLLSAAAWCERRLRFEAEPALTKGN